MDCWPAFEVVGREAPGAITPGIDFNTVRSDSVIRPSFAGPTEDFDEALHRIRPGLRG